MHQSTLSAISSSLAAEFSADVILAPRDLDAVVRAWELDSPEPAPFDDAAWAEHAEWSRSLDGGCGVSELTPDERDLLAQTISDREYRDFLQDMEERAAEYDAHRDYEDCFADMI